jgi:hypothetical protein
LKKTDLSSFITPATTSDVWLIPKRSSIIQIIGLVEILVNEGFEGKVWNQGKQEAVATKMRKRKLTKAKSFSAQSVRTLFANGPKYLGFVYTDADTDSANVQRKIIVTKAGKQLAAENLLAGGHYASLDEWEKYHKLPPSDAIGRQLFKLIMNNPVSNNYGVGSLYPYRNTLKLCQELGYLDKEEIGFLIFAMKSDSDYAVTRDLILEFRDLVPSERKAKIDNYKKSEAGQVTLVKAPTAHYFMSFCKSSGYFSVVDKSISKGFILPALEIKKPADAKALISSFNASKPFEFGSDKSLWIEYFGDVTKDLPPREVEIDFSFNKPGEFLVRIQRNSQIASLSSTEGNGFKRKVSVFDGDQIELEIYAGNGAPVKSDKFHVEPNKASYPRGNFSIDDKAPLVFDRSTKHLIDCLNQIAVKGWDDVFLEKLEIYKALTGIDAKNNRLKGGRLEQLTSHLFKNMTTDGLIDGFKWYGKVDANDLPSPAPGGKEGNPDLVFEFEDYAAVIELTTIKGTAAQWSSSEAASVPDHISKYRHSNPKAKIVGFFVAPSINSRILKNFKAHAAIDKTPIICLTIEEFAALALDSRDDLRKKFLDWEVI